MTTTQKNKLLTMYAIVVNGTLSGIYEYDNGLMKFLNKIAEQYHFDQCNSDLEKLKAFKPVASNFDTCNCGGNSSNFVKRFHPKWIQCTKCDGIFRL